MGLLTGIPEGNVQNQDELWIEGAPYIYYQDNRADPLNNPDGDNYFWGMSGTTTYPAFALACYEDVALADDLTVNAIRCDQVGDRGVIQKRNHLVFSFSLSTLVPLSVSQLNSDIPNNTAPLTKSGSGLDRNPSPRALETDKSLVAPSMSAASSIVISCMKAIMLSESVGFISLIFRSKVLIRVRAFSSSLMNFT